MKAAGTNWLMLGAGLSTTKFTAAPEALLDEPLTAITESVFAVESCPAGMAAVTCALLTNEVFSGVPPTSMAVEVVNPLPFTVRVVAELPANTEAGEIVFTTGGGAVPEEEEPAKEPPPHPAR